MWISQTGGANFRGRKSLLCGKMKEIGPDGRVLSAPPLDPKILPESRKFLCPSEKMYQKTRMHSSRMRTARTLTRGGGGGGLIVKGKDDLDTIYSL